MAPSAWQSKKIILFYFAQNSVSTFLFSTGKQSPSFQQQSQTQESIHIPDITAASKPRGIGTASPHSSRGLRSHCESRHCGHNGQYQVEAVVWCPCSYQTILCSNWPTSFFTSMTSRVQRSEELKGPGQRERSQARQRWED